MTSASLSSGQAELRAAQSASVRLILAVIVFSMAVNALMLTGPLYMLQVYDRVLASRSEATLVVLTGLVIGLFLALGVLEYARARVMVIVGARLQERLDGRVFAAAMQRAAVAPNDPVALSAQRDLEAIRTFQSSPVLLAVFDLPWIPIFILPIFLFHPLLGWLAIAGGASLITVTLLNQRLSARPQGEAGRAATEAERMSDQLKNEAEALRALGMSGSSFDRWQIARRKALLTGIGAVSMAGGFGTLTRTVRLFLQSAMLGLGAWLVLQDALSPGAMIVASILMGRGLAPIEAAVGQWAVAQRAFEGKRRLATLLSQIPPGRPRTALPRPRAILEVDNLLVCPPGETVPILRLQGFRLAPGQAVGVIGQSGSGKTTLAKALTGAWLPLSGKIRLDGAPFDQYDPDVLGRLIGYLPQRVALFDGTIAENIARFDPSPDSDRITAAACRAGAHEMIKGIGPLGYDTPVTALGGRLSGGQMQRIGLARALYGDPEILILDEPNANLDDTGTNALNQAIRLMKKEGKSALIMTHRPKAIEECEFLLVLESGVQRAFGPRDEVLAKVLANRADILPPSGPGIAG